MTSLCYLVSETAAPLHQNSLPHGRCAQLSCHLINKLMLHSPGGAGGQRGMNLLIHTDGRCVNLGGKASVDVCAGVR